MTVIDNPARLEDSNMFHIAPLALSDPDAAFMHLWWSGDNGFSFSAQPVHNHVVAPGDTSVLIPTYIF